MQIWVSKTTILSEKGLFQWVGMEDMVSKFSEKIKYRSLHEKSTPFPHTGWPWWPFKALFVLCRAPVSATTLANANLGRIRANIRRIWPDFQVRACTSSHYTLYKMHFIECAYCNMLSWKMQPTQYATCALHSLHVVYSPLTPLQSHTAHCTFCTLHCTGSIQTCM